MGKSNIDIKDLLEFQKKLQKLQKEQVQQLSEDCIKELTARLLSKLIKRTPVGKYKGDVYISKSGKKRYRKYKTVQFETKDKKIVSFKASINKNGGTLRRGWTSKTHKEAENGNGKGADVNEYLRSISVRKEGNKYTIEIQNPVLYAEYVEYGHRTRNHKGWVEGRFMLTISEQELKTDAPRIIEEKLNKFLEGCFNG